jgi:diaminopimelate decarboxylase
MPMSESFKKRLFPSIVEIADHFGTPFHIYDETGIRETCDAFMGVFSRVKGFREYYAVKALPNPVILCILKEMGCGFDCSSIPELLLSRRVGGYGDDIMFTSNNTSSEEFEAAAADGGCILNLDDISLVAKVPEMPEMICFRFNPGPKRSGNSIIGNPVEAKYGLRTDQLPQAYRLAIKRGAKRFGIHSMLVSNSLSRAYMVKTVAMLLETIAWLSGEIGIRFEFVNMGGGLGIPYKPSDQAIDINRMAHEITSLLSTFKSRNGYEPNLYIESGRYITGPHGVLVTRAINRKETYRTHIGVDACMSSLMRPAVYGAYHHIEVIGKHADQPLKKVDVVGSLCENNDKFAIQRALPEINDGDILCIHDTGAHGHAMGFNYNGRLRPQELLLKKDGSIVLIRRAEAAEDYFATLNFKPDVMTDGTSLIRAA